MIHSVKNLSSDQRMAIESLLGRAVSDEEQVSLLSLPATPEWMRSIQRDAKMRGVAGITLEDINAEITAARRDRNPPSAG